MRQFILSILTLLLLAPLSANAEIAFKVDRADLKRPSYLFGTHHMAPVSMLDTLPEVMAVLDDTEAVIGEIDLTAGALEIAGAISKYSTAPADSTITLLLTPDELKTLDAEFRKISPIPGAGLENFSMLKPMAIASLAAIGIIKESLPEYKEGEQLDAFFQQEAKQSGRPVVPLETPEQQAQLLYCSMPIAVQLQGLKDMLLNPEETARNAAALNAAYARGDIDALAEISRTGETADGKAFMEALLSRRNAEWLKVIPELIAERSSLIAVGALHLAGPDGLVEALRRLGYTVTPLERTPRK